MKVETKQRKKAMIGFKQMTGTEQARQSMYQIMLRGKRALDDAFLDMGRMMAESIMLIEREELSGSDYHPTHPGLKKWSHEPCSIYIGDQKIKVNRPRLRDDDHGEIDLKSYKKMREQGQFSEEVLEKVMRGVSAQKYE